MRRIDLLRNPKRLIPILIGSVAGIFVLIDRLFPGIGSINNGSQILLNWATVIAAFALIAGSINVIIHHIKRLASTDPKRWYSIALLLGVIIPPALAIYGYTTQGRANVLELGLFQDVIRWVYAPISISLLALLTFFALTAAIQAFGAGQREAVIVVSVALVFLVLQLPLLAGLPYLGETLGWIQRYIVMAGLRGLIFGAAIGAIVASIRILLGIDLPYLDR